MSLAHPQHDPAESQGGSPRIKIALAVVIALAAIALGVARLRGPASALATDVWYYDLGTNKLFSHLEAIPPIAAPSGQIDGEHAGVLAMVYSCGTCDDENRRFVAWMVKSKPMTGETMEKQFVPASAVNGPGARMAYLISEYPESWLVRFPDSPDWLESQSAEVKKRQARALERCGKSEAKPCAGPGAK